MSEYQGGALCIGGGSSTNDFSTPTAWRAGFPMRFTVGNQDIEGATSLPTWSAKKWAENASASYRAAGHPSSITYTEDDHHSYDFAGILSGYLPSLTA